MTADDATAAAAAAAERKRKRREAWKKRQEEQQQEKEERARNGGFRTTALPSPSAGGTPAATSKPRVTMGLGSAIKGRKRKKKRPPPGRSAAGFLGGDDAKAEEEEEEAGRGAAGKIGLLDVEEFNLNAKQQKPQEKPVPGGDEKSAEPTPKRRKKRGGWDVKDDSVSKPAVAKPESKTQAPTATEKSINDALDTFMMRLEAGDGDEEGPAPAHSDPGEKHDDPPDGTARPLHLDSSGSMVRMARASTRNDRRAAVVSARVTNVEVSSRSAVAAATATAGYTFSDWESDAPATPFNEDGEDDENEEEEARRAFIDALKKSKPPEEDPAGGGGDRDGGDDDEEEEYETKREVKTEKERREDAVRQLAAEASRVRKSAHVAVETGRIYNDLDGGVMEEAERSLAALTAAPDALEVLAEMNKKKELRAVDHANVDYLPVRKNLYIVPRAVAQLTPEEVAQRRARLGVKVRGKGAPAPVLKFSEAGLSEKILSLLEKKNITEPFPVQAACLPCIMAGRDVIGIAKTGSGKTLAFLLPMLRHILDQPPLAPLETGPIGLIMVPARELAYQIHIVAKGLCKHLGLKSTAVYGGAGVAEQIGDLKRGTHILCATPGRLIDILTMNCGKLISLQRVSMVCLDESDRAFDMGFEPQVSAILAAVRPDRQTVLFSATFPKAVENLAKKSLRVPLEIIVGGRSVASDSVDQFAEVVEEEDKFLRLLQILGEHAGQDKKKVIVFVGKQDQADSLFEQLTRCGYSSLSIHGGMDQEDRDSNMSDFKRVDGVNVLVATSVAGRGLDVPSCGCVVNYSAPNHLEDYVHRVGRTGRASNRGVAYTFVSSTDEAKFAPNIVKAITEAGQSKNCSQELKDLANSFKQKVAAGEARWANSGYKGKGYTYDSSEMSDAQKLEKMEKRQALIEAGLLDPDDEEPKDKGQSDNAEGNAGGDGEKAGATKGMLAKVSAEVLALPGMREAFMKKAGLVPDDVGLSSTGENHFMEEMEINHYPQQARWKVTQKETTSRLQDEFQTAVTLKGQYVEPGKSPAEGDRKLYLHLEAQSRQILQNCILEIKRLLNEETLRVGARSASSGGGRYSVLS